MIAGVLLAAGSSVRFGNQKLLESWHGHPLLRHAASVLIDGGMTPLIVVIQDDERLRRALAKLPLRLVTNPRPEAGISRSIRLGIEALPADVDAALVAVADQPYLSPDAIHDLVKAFQPGSIVAPRYGSVVGNPRIYDRRFFAELMGLEGDRGGQVLARRHQQAVIEVALPAGMGRDIDRPSDWPA